jgi:hypothetical protein
MCYGRGGGVEYHVHDVESNLSPGYFGLAGVLTGSAKEAGPFLRSDGTVRRTVLDALARFHFDEYERIAFPANQIYLSGTRGHAVIAIYDDNSRALEKTLGDVLTAPAEGVILGHVPAARVLPKEIREFEKLARHVEVPNKKWMVAAEDLSRVGCWWVVVGG